MPSSGDLELSWNMIGRQKPRRFHPNQTEEVIQKLNHLINIDLENMMYFLAYDKYMFFEKQP